MVIKVFRLEEKIGSTFYAKSSIDEAWKSATIASRRKKHFIYKL